MTSSRKFQLAALVAAVVLALAAWIWWPKAPEPAPVVQRLIDGVEVFHRNDSKIVIAPQYPNPREMRVDGEFFVRVPQSPQPLIIRSRLLVLEVKGGSALRITAYSHEAGEQVEVLSGHVEARKNYKSSYMEPDQLDAGDMTMINRDIDLMEKEKADVAALRAWSEALVASAGPREP
jgi:ferric-dicitrate binding protein FerR (iron transport regulator)